MITFFYVLINVLVPFTDALQRTASTFHEHSGSDIKNDRDMGITKIR
jgi:hypothetical protein